MATKTISIDLDAYERLRRARRSRSESFSMVIKRAVWPAPPRTAGALLKASADTVVMDEDVLDRLETIQRGDEPPENPWQGE
jgi:predicted CopG family antitoxin